MQIRNHDWYQLVEQRIGWRMVHVSCSPTSVGYRIDVFSGNKPYPIYMGVAYVGTVMDYELEKKVLDVRLERAEDFMSDTTWLKDWLKQVKPLVLEAHKKSPKKKLKVLAAAIAFKKSLASIDEQLLLEEEETDG